MDWESVFDEEYRAPGATYTAIKRFIAEVARPMSAAEIRGVNSEPRNPFPASDRLHSTWRPCDEAKWVIPSRPLPAPYLSLLRWSDGGEFRNGGNGGSSSFPRSNRGMECAR